MLTILSPSKTQDYSEKIPANIRNFYTEPVLLEKSKILVDALRKKNIEEIGQLMQVSENIATLNYNRFQDFSTPFRPENARQALLAFRGDVYTDIATGQYKKNDFNFAQKHLCILSGLYGVLRPMDLIQPYRLEMKIKLKNSKGKDLYQFWDTQLTTLLNERLAEKKTKYLVNLASNEYYKALQPKKLEAEIVTPVFKEQKGGQYKVVAIYAKRARGMMANFIIENRIDRPTDLKTFSEGGYSFNEALSTKNEWIFTR